MPKKMRVTDLIEAIDKAVSKHKNPQLVIRHILNQQSNQRIAAILDVDPEHRQLIFSVLPIEQKTAVLDLINSHTLRSIIGHVSDSELIKIIEKAPSLISQKVVSVTERSRLNSLMPQILDDQRRQNLVSFVNYPARSVGRIIQPEVLTAPDSVTAEEALHIIAKHSIGSGPIHQVYVVDQKDNFIGTIAISDLIRTAKKTKLSDVHKQKPPVITPTTTQNKAAQLFRDYDLIEAPVIAADGTISGRLLVDDILDVLQQEYTEDIQKFAGITSEENLETPALGSSRRRLPWMIGNIFLDLIAVSVIMPFQETIGQVTALAVLMPVVSDMGGNVGIQSLTVSIRALSENKPQWKLVAKELSKEMRVGLLNGVILGTIIGIVALVGWQNPFLGFIVMTALFCNTILASVIGGVLPIILRKLKKDPAMMSGAILTTITDFFGFLIFLGLARVFLEQLL